MEMVMQNKQATPEVAMNALHQCWPKGSRKMRSKVQVQSTDFEASNAGTGAGLP